MDLRGFVERECDILVLSDKVTPKASWGSVAQKEGIIAMIHVYPVNDLKEHEVEGVHCPCEPEIDWKLGIVVHNAFDMREIEEFVNGKGN